MSTSEVLVPPPNFCMVCPGIYRSGYPSKKNFPFLKKLGLKSILFMCPEEYLPANVEFARTHGIRIFQYGVEGNKEPFIDIPDDVIREALLHLVDVRNHPLLIHCNKGKHRTGVVVGALRKMQNWSLTSIFDEYRRFAGTKVRMLDQQFVELFVPPHQYAQMQQITVPGVPALAAVATGFHDLQQRQGANSRAETDIVM
jgi:tyrosine-protein phosphatase SIW14